MDNEIIEATKCYYAKEFDKAEAYCLKGLILNKNKENIDQLFSILADIYIINNSLNLLTINFSQRIEFIIAIAEILINKSIGHAITLLKTGLQIAPNSPGILNNLGLISEELGQEDAAIEFYEAAIKLEENPTTYSNLAFLYNKYDRFEEQDIAIKKAYEMAPENYVVNFGYATIYLQKKDFKNGYFHLLKMAQLKFGDKFGIAYKKFSELAKEKDTISIVCRQGFGDTVLISRYLPFLPKYFKKVNFYIQPSLLSIVERNFSKLNNDNFQINFINKDTYTPVANPDVTFIDAFYLPWYCDIDFEHIPSPKKYLAAKRGLINKFHKKYFSTDKLKIGLCWQTGTNIKRGLRDRNVDFKIIEKLPRYFKDIQFYSVQKETCEELKNYKNIIDLSQELETFEETAAILKNLDLLVSVDTSTSNLAGALSVKTCLILPHRPEWRWFDDDISSWYNSIKLFKAPLKGGYEKVIKDIKKYIIEEIL